jgi:TnpA family transposase
MRSKSQRVRLLHENEISAIYQVPQFTESERHHYFQLELEEKLALKGLHQSARVYFVMQLGYFKAKHLLFDFTFHDMREDINYVISRHFPGMKRPKMLPSRNRMASINKKIVTMLGFQCLSNKVRDLMKQKFSQSIQQVNNPMHILKDIMAYMENEKIVFPSYSTLQDMVGNALIVEEKRIKQFLKKRLTSKTMALLDKLFTAQKDQRFYDLTLLKQNPKNFNFKMIQAEIEKHKKYYPLYRFSKRFLPELNISQHNIAYYGSLVDHYQVQSLQSFHKEKRDFYLICYVYHRFQLMNDQLIGTLIHYIDAYNKDAKVHAKSRASEVTTEIKMQHGLAGKTLIYWYYDNTLSNRVFSEIQVRAAKILSKEKGILLGEFLANDEVDKKRYEWEFHDKNFQCMIKNLRPLIKILDFQALPHNKTLLEGVKFIQSIFRSNQSLSDIDLHEFPLETIPSHLKQYLLEKDTSSRKKVKPVKSIYPYRYEFYVYDQLNKQLAENKIYINDTTQYKNFTDDLKLKNTARERKKLLKSLDAPRLNRSADELLNEFEIELEARIISVNEHIENGENKSIRIKAANGKTTWTLPYKKKSDEYNNPFYDKMTPINLVNVIHSVHSECKFLFAFTHIKQHGSKSEQDIQGIIACLIANATNLGTYKMGDSSDIPYTILRTIDENYIRLETLRAASDYVSNEFSQLPIYPCYNLGGFSHGAGDGQKYKTRWDTFNSRHSPKYYGLDKGVAPYSLGVNYNVINCIPDKGAHQHESHFLFDLVMNDTSDIEIERLSTDTEGSNQIMFVLMYFAGIDYTPCYRNIRKKFKKLHGFKNIGSYPEHYLIRPLHKVNKKLIIEEWNNIQDIITALLRNEVSISVITRKLCSHEMNDKTKRAMWELNNILQSIYLLRYIDDLELRRYVRAALNRIEAYHLLRRNIGETNGATFRGGSDMEVAIWNECARLIANVVMYFNASLLSRLKEIKEENGDLKSAEYLTHLSPIASQHINFGGRYEFGRVVKPLDIEKILKNMDEIEVITPKKVKR